MAAMGKKLWWECRRDRARLGGGEGRKRLGNGRAGGGARGGGRRAHGDEAVVPGLVAEDEVADEEGGEEDEPEEMRPDVSRLIVALEQRAEAFAERGAVSVPCPVCQRSWRCTGTVLRGAG